MRSPLQYPECPALSAGTDSLHILEDAGSDEAFRDIKLIHIHAEVVICICNGGFEKLFDILANELVGVFEYCGSNRNILASDEVEHYLNLARCNAKLFEICSGFLVFHSLFSFQPH